MEDTRLGAILIESGVIEEDELERCLEIQGLTGGSRALGQILIEQNAIASETLEDLLAIQDLRRSTTLATLENGSSDPDRFISAAMDVGATELHLSEGRPPLVRVGGDLRALSIEPLAGPEVWQFAREHVGMDVLEAIAEHHSMAADFNRDGLARGRITAFRHFDGIGLMIRLHPEQLRSPSEAGLDERLIDAVRGGKGLVLLTGEHGSGISETMSTLFNECQKASQRFVLVLDESLEFAAPEGEALVSIRRVGEHTKDYVSGLQAALRENPDVIFIGDASRPEAFDMALLAAESGRSVVAAVHAADTLSALKRVVEYYPDYDQRRVRASLASVLQCVFAVRLVPDTAHAAQRLASELLIFDETVRDVMRGGSFEQLELLLGIDDDSHGHSLDASMRALVHEGLVSAKDVFDLARSKTQMLGLAASELHERE